MKKVMLSLIFLGGISWAASAQQVTESKANDKKMKVETANSETKIKRTTTPKQKVHNLIHPKRKQYSGIKVKHEVKKQGD
jgi:hypothetical protein